MQQKTSKCSEGYKYYVYVGPGNIRYFETLEEAKAYQVELGTGFDISEVL